MDYTIRTTIVSEALQTCSFRFQFEILKRVLFPSFLLKLIQNRFVASNVHMNEDIKWNEKKTIRFYAIFNEISSGEVVDEIWKFKCFLLEINCNQWKLLAHERDTKSVCGVQ